MGQSRATRDHASALVIACFVGALCISQTHAFSNSAAMGAFGRKDLAAAGCRGAPTSLRMQQGGDVSDVMRRLREMEAAASTGGTSTYTAPKASAPSTPSAPSHS